MSTPRAQSTELRAQKNNERQPAFTSGSYRNLKIWQRSIELSIAVYKLTSGFPREEVYGLTSQLRRAAVSAASNIVEGYGRASRGEFRQFVGMARGSVLELQTQLVIARQLGFGKDSQLQTAEALAEETGKMTWAMMQKL
jgi:four helix bundle protein